MTAKVSIPLGKGIYGRPEAARLLRVTAGRLGRWVMGYTYELRDGRQRPLRRRQAPLIATDLPKLGNTVALSFLELMELRVVKALLDKGLSLQHIRAAGRLAADSFHTSHPFASRRVFTDGRYVFSAVSDEAVAPHIVKWRPGHIEQVIAGPIFEHFLNEIEFDDATALAHRWWPCGRDFPVVLDPRVSFGAPTVQGTGVRTTTVSGYADHTSNADAAVAFELDEFQVGAAVEFEGALTSA